MDTEEDDSIRSTIESALGEDGVSDDAEEFAEELDSSSVDDVPHGTAEESGETAESVEAQSTESASESDPIAEAPSDLSPAARAEWASVPRAVQEAIHKRSEDFFRGIKQYKDAAEYGTQLNKIMEPHAQMIQSMGGPQEVMGSLLQVAQNLSGGSPLQRASMIKGLMDQFQVDVGTLDKLLMGEQVDQNIQSQHQQHVQYQQQINPLQQQLQQTQSQLQQFQSREQNQIREQLNEWAKDKPFFSQVKEQMRHFMTAAAQGGQRMSWDQAYSAAIAANPQLAAQKAQQDAAAAAKQKQQAAAQLNGSPGGDLIDSGDDSIRGAINSAWNNLQGRV